jgi:hypothetical protein
MKNQNQSIFQKTYLTVSPAAAKYFKKIWMETTGLSERTFRHRLAHPEMDDILLFCHVCRTDLAETLQPFCDKFKNIPPYKTNLQLSIA